MEINPVEKIQPVDLFDPAQKDRLLTEQTGLLTIKKALKSALENLWDWFENFNPNQIEIYQAKLVRISDLYKQAFDKLQAFKKLSQENSEIAAALDIETSLENHFNVIQKVTHAPYWKYDDFSFTFLFSLSSHVPLFELKRMILHVFKKLSFSDRKQVQGLLKNVIDQLA